MEGGKYAVSLLFCCAPGYLGLRLLPLGCSIPIDVVHAVYLIARLRSNCVCGPRGFPAHHQLPHHLGLPHSATPSGYRPSASPRQVRRSACASPPRHDIAGDLYFQLGETSQRRKTQRQPRLERMRSLSGRSMGTKPSE